LSGPRILVVDDEDRFRQALALSLGGHGYDVKESATGNQAIADADIFRPEVILLDLMLPDKDGVDVCREIRRDSEVPIIVLSVIGDEASKIRALDSGADDYLTKPFGSGELLARIRAALRRSSPGSITESVFRAGSLTIDFKQRLVTLGEEELHLTPTEFSLLAFFAGNAGRVCRHQAILRNVWGEQYIEDTQILRTYINQLRAKLRDDPARSVFIRTEPGVGYRFIQPDA
jgi:two-component system KDP operon response regulator KdpE